MAINAIGEFNRASRGRILLPFPAARDQTRLKNGAAPSLVKRLTRALLSINHVKFPAVFFVRCAPQICAEEEQDRSLGLVLLTTTKTTAGN